MAVFSKGHSVVVVKTSEIATKTAGLNLKEWYRVDVAGEDLTIFARTPFELHTVLDGLRDQFGIGDIISASTGKSLL